MWSEILSSFYTMPVNLYVGGQLRTFTLRWYRAPAGAAYLGMPCVLFSHVWDNNPGESQPGEIGEVGFPRTWDKGDNRGGYQGRCFRGDPSWFATGQLPAVLPGPGPCLCNIPPAVGSGGIVLGGAATPYPTNCQRWVNAVPLLTEGGVQRSMTVISGQNYKLQSLTDPTLGWTAGSAPSAPCHGGSGTFLNVVTWPALGNPQPLLIDSGGYPSRDADWFVLPGSPYLSGLHVQLHE